MGAPSQPRPNRILSSKWNWEQVKLEGWRIARRSTMTYSVIHPIPHHCSCISPHSIYCNRVDLLRFWPGTLMERAARLLWNWLDMIPVNKLVSMIQSLWGAQKLKRFTLLYHQFVALIVCARSVNLNLRNKIRNRLLCESDQQMWTQNRWMTDPVDYRIYHLTTPSSQSHGYHHHHCWALA